MSEDTITKEDLREAMRDMTAEMNRGFDGINDRLDELNGRTRKAENVIAVHDERWRRLDNATKMTPADNPENAGVQGDWKVLAKVGAILGGILAGLGYGAVKVYQMVAGK